MNGYKSNNPASLQFYNLFLLVLIMVFNVNLKTSWAMILNIVMFHYKLSTDHTS